MIIKLFLIAIILYIVINQLMETNKNQPVIVKPVINISPEQIKVPEQVQLPEQIKAPVQINQQTRLQHNVIDDEDSDNTRRLNNNQQIQIQRVERMSNNNVQEFDRPLPWTKIIYIEEDEFPYYYHFKPVIPSLNDFEKWKQIIPNIDFNPNSRELIIPSKDEASALAIANLICINFSGQMTMQDILNKDLIRISITKAKTHELVRTKLKEQIMEVLYGKAFNKVQTNYEEDLAKHNINEIGNNNIQNKPISLKSDNFKDTFHHFSDNIINSNEVDAYDSSNYSYL